MTTTLIMLGITVVTLIYVISLYNNLIQLKHGVAKAWANIDVLLKQRHDELPKLIETCKGYMQYEQKTLQAITELRTQAETVGKDTARALREGG